jgi:hypothetical protein
MRFLVALAAIGLWFAGCAAGNVNPAQARANTGYVDFHTGSPAELNWDVARYDEGAKEFRRVYSRLEVPPQGFLRLAFSPGRDRLRVTFLNRVIARPVEIEVEVQAGKVTPVRVTLTDAGVALVRTKETSAGGSAYGRYGRRTRIGSAETTMYALSAAAEAPVAYQSKEQMPYAR